MSPEFIYYSSCALAMGLGSIGGGLGQGIAGMGALESINRQELAGSSIFRAMIIGLALIESGIVVALVVTFLTIFGAHEVITWGIALSQAGVALAVGFASAATSIASGYVVKAAVRSIARQPFFAQKITSLMLLSQSIIEAPIIFAFIITLLIRANMHSAMHMIDGVKNLSAGLVVALGSIGPSIGQAVFAYAACTAVGKNKKSYEKIFPFSLLSEAVIETPMIFCLLLAFIILFLPPLADQFAEQVAAIVSAAFALGMGSIGTAIGIGYAASRSCYQIAREPKNYSIIVRTTLLVEAFVESAVIYAMIIALMLIMKAS